MQITRWKVSGKNRSMQPPVQRYRIIFAERLRQLRKARGYKTARSFALTLGVEQNTYTRYERGEVEPSLMLIDRIWTVLGLPVNDLLGPGFGGDAIPTIPGLHEDLVETDGRRGEQDHVERASRRRDALAWTLAEYCTRIKLVGPDGGASDGLAQFRLTAALYTELNRNPFEAVKRLGASTRLEQLAPQDRGTLAGHIETFIAAATALVLQSTKSGVPQDAKLRAPRPVNRESRRPLKSTPRK
jgi:transcriptional regulator with XRE-family HTH domain